MQSHLENLEKIPYLKIRKAGWLFSGERKNNLQNLVHEAMNNGDHEWADAYAKDLVWLYENEGKEWGVCFREGEVYHHFKTYKELIKFIEEHANH